MQVVVGWSHQTAVDWRHPFLHSLLVLPSKALPQPSQPWSWVTQSWECVGHPRGAPSASALQKGSLVEEGPSSSRSDGERVETIVIKKQQMWQRKSGLHLKSVNTCWRDAWEKRLTPEGRQGHPAGWLGQDVQNSQPISPAGPRALTPLETALFSDSGGSLLGGLGQAGFPGRCTLVPCSQEDDEEARAAGGRWDRWGWAGREIWPWHSFVRRKWWRPKGRTLGSTRVNKGSARRRQRRAVRKRWRKQEMWGQFYPERADTNRDCWKR